MSVLCFYAVQHCGPSFKAHVLRTCPLFQNKFLKIRRSTACVMSKPCEPLPGQSNIVGLVQSPYLLGLPLTKQVWIVDPQQCVMSILSEPLGCPTLWAWSKAYVLWTCPLFQNKFDQKINSMCGVQTLLATGHSNIVGLVQSPDLVGLSLTSKQFLDSRSTAVCNVQYLWAFWQSNTEGLSLTSACQMLETLQVSLWSVQHCGPGLKPTSCGPAPYFKTSLIRRSTA